MLCLHQRDDRLRGADNLLPTAEGGLATRPGALQVIAGPIDAADDWGDRIVAEKSGRIVVWDGTEHDVRPAGAVLRVTSFQALTANAARENRAYVADGVNPLWYIARRAGAYVWETVRNTVLDPAGAPYPIPVPSVIATWRNRIFLGYGTNRVQHCQNDDPAQWDPLWTVEQQGQNPARVQSLVPHADVLAAGLEDAVWEITGTSQFNFARDEAMKIGVCGAAAMDSDGIRLAVLAPQGVFQVGNPDPVSEDLRDAFVAPIGIGELVLDPRRQLVLALIAGRLFAMHLAQPGKWGEIVGVQANGLIRTTQYVGWYGADGLWLLGARDAADKRLDGTAVPFIARYDTWEQRPNLDGRGRALCNRTVLRVAGSSRANATYRVIADGTLTYEIGFALADEAVPNWADNIEGLTPLSWPTRPVRRELVPRLAGGSFRHVVEAGCYMEILNFAPQYRFGQEQAA